MVGYRDSAYLYYPYFQWIDQQWQNGEIPLWNPYCNLGYPVVADGTSSVFYPGKLIFLLRFISYPARYGMYLSLHVLWAAVTAYLLAYRLTGRPLGAGVTSFSYAFGGSVLFQVTNVVFLVSASWLPLGVLAISRVSRRRNFGDLLLLSATSSMMVLGGDPQMAYVLSMLTAATFVFRLIWCRKRYHTWGIWFAKLAISARQILVFGVIAFCLSAIQLLPTYSWSQNSLRVREQLSIDKLSLKPMTGTHLHAIYEFSQPPWTLLELILPNVFGKPFPQNCRWADSFPGADRIWVPSLYLGLVAIAFAFGSMSIRGRSRKRNWLTWVAIFFTLASFGWYGASWAIKELILMSGLQIDQASENIGAQVGGIYWLMTIVLPEFDSFRYPAKLFVFANLAISVLAGIGISHFATKSRAAIFMLLVFLLVIAGWIWGIDSISSYLHQRHWESRKNELFGPFCESTWRQNCNWTLIYTGSLIVAVLTLFMFARFKRLSVSRFGGLLFVFLVTDLLVANHWLIPQIDAEVFRRPVDIVKKIESLGKEERFAAHKGSLISCGLEIRIF